MMLLTGGMYECKTCEPPVRIKSDGSDQPVTGSPYYDSMAIEAVSDHQIRITSSVSRVGPIWNKHPRV